MSRLRPMLSALPLALLIVLVVLFGALIVTHLPTQAAGRLSVADALTPTDGIPIGIVVATDTAALPTATKPPSIYDTATPMPPPPPTDTPGPPPDVAVLVVTPLSLSLDCRSTTYAQPITITNNGTEQKGWNTGVSDQTLFKVGPANGTAAGNTWLYPGQSITAYVAGTGAPKGSTGTATVYEVEPVGALGPIAGVIAITCV
jgi:hypothetical protein